MISLDMMINYVKSNTSYTVTHTRLKEPDLAETSDLPTIYIGYGTIDSKNPNGAIEYDIYSMNGEDLVQSFDIQIVCKQKDLVTIWKTIYKVLIGWNPVLLEGNYSGLTYAQGGVIGISNDNLWWLDRWRIGFPVTTIL